MRKTIIFSVLSLYLFLSPFGFLSAAETSSLELTYPDIPGMEEITPEYISTGLPEYVNYIFRLAVLLIGLVIFGVVIYNGINYLTSVGEPAKLGAARSGISSGFLGVIILLSAYLIFNTINPQLVELNIRKLPPLSPVIMPGIYVCSYEVPDIEDYISDYKNIVYRDGKITDESLEKQNKAVEKIKEKMGPNDEGACFRMSFSGNFANFAVQKNQNTFFSIPDRRIVGGELRYDVYEYGLILHEKDNQAGKCEFVTDPDWQIYDYVSPIDYLPDFNFKSKSFTLFRKTASPSAEAEGVVLYACVDYNQQIGLCPRESDVDIWKNFQLTAYSPVIRKFGKSDLNVNAGTLAKNTRSIQIDPKGIIFAVLFEEDGFQGKCEVIKSNDNNLLDNSIGRCGQCGWIWAMDRAVGLAKCELCLESMYVINGQVL
jgi:hypothetical protein